jgi:hypothetical protein
MATYDDDRPIDRYIGPFVEGDQACKHVAVLSLEA